MCHLLKILSFIFIAILIPFKTLADTASVVTAFDKMKKVVQTSTVSDALDVSKRLLEKEISEYKSQNNLSKAARAIYKYSDILTQEGEYEPALIMLNSIIHREGDAKLDSLKPFLFGKISGVYLYIGNYRAAIDAIDKAQSYSINHLPFQINLHVLTSNVWAKLPQAYQPNGYKKALTYLEKAAVLANDNGDSSAYSLIINNKADLYLKLNELEKCREQVLKALKIAENNNYEKVIQLSLVTLAELNFKEKNFSAAFSHLKKALNLNPNATDVVVLIEGNLLLAKLFMEQKQFKKAEETLIKTEQILLKQNDKARLIQVFEIKSELYTNLGNFKKALYYFKQYQVLQEDILSREVAFEVKHLDLMYQETEKDKAIMSNQLHLQKQKQELQKKNFQIVLLITVLGIVLLVVLFFYGRNRQQRQLNRQMINMERLRAAVEGEELERARIAKELHDGIGGMLAVIGMQFSAVLKEREKNNPANLKILDLIKSTSDEIRKTAHNLLPTALETNNLADAVDVYCSEISNSENLLVDVEMQGDFSGLDITFSIAMFRIIQELFQNIIKHAQASHAVVVLEIETGKMTIHIEDNGNGFNMDELGNKGIGLKNIKERIKKFGGSFNIKSEKNIGTSIAILFENLDNQF